MDFIRRAWLFTKAKIGRTILLIVAFSAILIFVLSGLIILRGELKLPTL